MQPTPMPRHAWHNGQIVAWEDCVLHARSQGAFWGANVFEGVRAYWSPETGQLNAFRLDEHLDRLHRSMKSVRMDIDHSKEELEAACLELLRANEVREDAHLVVVAYFGMAPNLEGLTLIDDTGVHITAIPAPRSPAYHQGASACISSWRRISDDSMPPRIKTGANYHNSRLAHQEAKRNGYDTTLILNQRGTVAEAPGACVMMVRDGRLVTPPATAGVLEGITVESVTEIARDELGLDLDVREIDRTELYVADELFLCGTLVEILPLTSIDRLPVGDGGVGTLTRTLQERYDRTARAAGGHPEWLTPVHPIAPALAVGAAGA